MEPLVATYEALLSPFNLSLGWEHRARWSNVASWLSAARCTAMWGFQAQKSTEHFLALLAFPQFGPSILHGEKQKKNSTCQL